MVAKKPRVKAVYTVEKKLEVLNALGTSCKGNLSLAARIHAVPKPRLFICDGHNSHLTYKVAKAAYDNNVHILCLPPPH